MDQKSMSSTIKNTIIFFIFIIGIIVTYLFWNVVAPFLISLVIAYILNPIVAWIENIHFLKIFKYAYKLGINKEWAEKVSKNKISRPFAVITVFLVCVLLFVIVVVPVVFSVSKDAKDLIERVKQTDIKDIMSFKSRSKKIVATTDNNSKEINENINLSEISTGTAIITQAKIATESDKIWIFDFDRILIEYPNIASYVASIDNIVPKDEIVSHLTSAIVFIKDYIINLISNLFSFVVSAFSGMVNMVMVPILVFYILIDIETIYESLKKLIPPDYRERTLKILNDIDKQLGKMLRGMLLSNSIFAILMVLGLGICGLRFWFSLGLLAGIANFVPYLGGVFTIILSILVAVAQFGFTWAFVSMIIKLAIAIGIVQFIDVWWSQPYIIGGEAGLSPLVTMLALAVSGAIAGIPGMILAVPTAVIFKIVGKEIYHELYDRA